MNDHKHLESVLIRSTLSSEVVEGKFSVLGMEDIAGLLDLEQLTLASLKDRRLYFPGSVQFYEDSLSGRGIVIGCHIGGRLVGFRSIWFPGLDCSNLGFDIGLNEVEQLKTVAHLERSCVHPEFRGNRLQIRMTEIAIKLALNENFNYLFSTVAPQNYASMIDKFTVGMFICKILKKYDGLDRYIFFKNIKNTISEINIIPGSCRNVSGEDIIEQYAALSTNGTIGIGLYKNLGKTNIKFCSTNRLITEI